jgi:hypothetical protein
MAGSSLRVERLFFSYSYIRAPERKRDIVIARPKGKLILSLLNLKLIRRSTVDMPAMAIKKYMPGSARRTNTIPKQMGMHIRKRGISLFSTVSSE